MMKNSVALFAASVGTVAVNVATGRDQRFSAKPELYTVRVP